MLVDGAQYYFPSAASSVSIPFVNTCPREGSFIFSGGRQSTHFSRARSSRCRSIDSFARFFLLLYYRLGGRWAGAKTISRPI